MKKLGLESCQTQNHTYKNTGNAYLDKLSYLDHRFNVEAPNIVWCGDVIYIWTVKRWTYLAMVMDINARKPVGCAMSLSPNSELTSNALKMAYKRRDVSQ